jgi:IS30 family transposase
MAIRWGLFDLICSGSTKDFAARVMGVSKSTADRWWADAGGMALMKGAVGGLAVVVDDDGTGPRGYRIGLSERIDIQSALHRGLSVTEIAMLLDRPRPTVWREIGRNSNADGTYHALMAQQRSNVKALRPKPFKLVRHPEQRMIEASFDEGWSPRVISHSLKVQFPNDKAHQVSYETLYNTLYVQSRGSLRADLYKNLSTSRAARKPRISVTRQRKIYDDALKIDDRPDVKDRSVPGHWEGDLIMGSGGTAIGTLVERTTRFVILLHLPGNHQADTVAGAMITAMGDLPAHIRRSVTWDRGTELAAYDRIQLELQAPVYFCDPHSPWQRGSNENTNRLLRHWFAKSSDLSVHTAADVARVAATLNKRPRETLKWKTPAQALTELLAEQTAA